MAHHLTYAIGDIHGCCDLLRAALVAVRRHAGGREHQIIALGDYIDRGDDARGVIELLMAYRSAPLACLRGNHEQMLIEAFDSGSSRATRAWLQHGGMQTLLSYGLDPDDPGALARLPPEHIAWMRCRSSKIESAFHIFVHAGVRPELDITQQDEADFLWIRNGFVRAKAKQFVDPRHIVHGHTPLWEGKPEASLPEFLNHRTNLDTGAYMTGILSVGVFLSDQRGGAVDLLSIS